MASLPTISGFSRYLKSSHGRQKVWQYPYCKKEAIIIFKCTETNVFYSVLVTKLLASMYIVWLWGLCAGHESTILFDPINDKSPLIPPITRASILLSVIMLMEHLDFFWNIAYAADANPTNFNTSILAKSQTFF